MVGILTQIEIASPPERVREIFLDFERWQEWSKGPGIKSIERVNKQKQVVEAGDKLNMAVEGAKFSPTVLSNTPESFAWRGSFMYGAFVGDHTFQFLPSESTSGHTTLINSEEFSGVLSIAMWPSLGLLGKTKEAFEKQNVDFKAWVESQP